MSKFILSGMFFAVNALALNNQAHAQPISVSLSTTIGNYDLQMDSEEIHLSHLDIFTSISFVYNTNRSLYPSPAGEKVTFESFAVLFATTQPATDAMQLHVAGDSIVRELQESTLFLSGIDTAFPYADYNGIVDFNVLSMDVSTVRLPSSAPLFGAALLGLAGLGYAAKRKKVTTI